MYNAEVTFDIYSSTESTWEESFDDLQKAVEWVKHVCTARKAIAYINGQQVFPRAGMLFDRKGNEVCTNPSWHEIFAHKDVRIPTNPATYEAIGKPL